MSTHSVPTDLCHALQQGQLCYVSRVTPAEQHALCLHTYREMELRGYRSSVIRLSALKTQPHAQANWDSYLIKELWHTFYPTNRTRLSQWLNAAKPLSPKARLIQFSDDLLLSELCEAPITILIDTIDTLIDNPSAINDIFAWISHCYDLRDTYLSYHHLSFALFGQSDLFTIQHFLLNHTNFELGTSQLKIKGFKGSSQSANVEQFHLNLSLRSKPVCSQYSPSLSRSNQARQTQPQRIEPTISTYSTYSDGRMHSAIADHLAL